MSFSTLSIFLLATLIVATVQAEANHIHLLRPKSGAGGSKVPGLSCLSWRLGEETNNIIGWKTIPEACEGYVGHYMLGKQYRKDSKAVTDEAFLYAKSLNLSKNGKNLWVFDIDETTLSNLPYYADHGFGVEVFNSTTFNQWVFTGKAPMLPESLALYKRLLSLGIKTAFITGRSEDQRAVTLANLKAAGYHSWDKLVLKGSSYQGVAAVLYKSAERKKLENGAYTIVGNIGDQWSDLLGTSTAKRSFKLPDPLYYIS
ncbi:hypothetical protein UlMin_018590 [Ulmus minor]